MKIDLLSRAQLSIINKNSLRYPLAIAEKDYFPPGHGKQRVAADVASLALRIAAEPDH